MNNEYKPEPTAHVVYGNARVLRVWAAHATEGVPNSGRIKLIVQPDNQNKVLLDKDGARTLIEDIHRAFEELDDPLTTGELHND